MQNWVLRILSGMHAGAAVALSADQKWTIGCGESSGILLVDPGVQNIHAQISWIQNKQAWCLSTSQPGVEVFGYALKPSIEIPLQVGSQFTVAGIAFDIADGESEAEDIGVVAANAEEIHRAKLGFLRRTQRLDYVTALLKVASQRNYALIGIGAVLGSGLIVAILLTRPQLTQDYLAGTNEQIAKLYPDVTHSIDPVTGFITYQGYVKDQRELGALRQMVLKANDGAVVMNVLPMDVLAFNVATLLEAHYRDAQITVIGSGEIMAEIPTEDAIKDLLGWNIPVVQAEVLRELPELKRFHLAIKKNSLPSVDVPLNRLGFSIISSASDAPFAVNQKGDRLFQGASTNEGQIGPISLCGIALESHAAAAEFKILPPKGTFNECK